MAAIISGRPRDLALERQLGLLPASNLVIASMIGAGIFTTSGLLIRELGDPVVMLALWLVGGVLALCGALCYGALGSAMPRAGGEYVYLGELYHPLLGFLTGWVSFFVGFSAPLAASSLGCAEYLAQAFPALVLWWDPVLLKKALAILIIGVLGAVHLRGLELGALVQNWLTMGKVLLILALILAGFTLGQGSLGNLGAGQPLPAGAAGWKTMGLSLMWIMFAYSGWNASAYIGSEIRDPRRTLPRSLLLGTGLVTLLYLGLNLLFVFAIPPEEMSGVIAVGGLAASRLFGNAFEALLSALIGFALLSAVSALIILGPRVYYAMARDGYFFRFAANVHPTFRVPAWSILLQCTLAAVMVASGTFDQILTYMGFCLGIFPIVAVLGVFRLARAQEKGIRDQGSELPPQGERPRPQGSGLGAARPAFRIPGHPLPAMVFAGGTGTMLVLAFMERPAESSIALGTVALGVPAFFFFRRAKRRNAA
jgi:APA family basic amino acid/polyamine antiporter